MSRETAQQADRLPAGSHFSIPRTQVQGLQNGGY